MIVYCGAEPRTRVTQPPAVPIGALLDALDTGQNGAPSFRRAADMQKLIDAAFESSATRLPVSVA